MCSIEEGFRLCTCASDEELARAPISWHLARINPSRPLAQRRGRVVASAPSPKADQLRHDVLTRLNARSCFDFPYQPEEGDLLRLVIRDLPKHSFNYRYSDNGWTVDNTNHLATWKSQLEDYQKGRLE